MLDTTQSPPRPSSGLPLAPGVGFKSRHFQDVLDAPGPVRWIEIHAENYMGGGARPTLIEWDTDVPDWPTLRAEAERAATVLETALEPALQTGEA